MITQFHCASSVPYERKVTIDYRDQVDGLFPNWQNRLTRFPMIKASARYEAQLWCDLHGYVVLDPDEFVRFTRVVKFPYDLAHRRSNIQESSNSTCS